MEHARRIQEQCQMVRNFNQCCPTGQKVKITNDDKSTFEAKTRTPAQLLSGHTAVVWLEDVAGCYALTRIETIPNEAPSRAESQIPTDKELLDFLQSLTDEHMYSGRVVCRMSTTRRGWRLHETSRKNGVPNVREAIAHFVAERKSNED